MKKIFAFLKKIFMGSTTPRHDVSRPSSRLTINILFVVITVSLIATVLLINGIALRLSERYSLRVDLTEGAVFEISDATRELISMIDTPVEIFVLSEEGGFTGDRYLVQAQQIFNQYPRHSNFISLEYIDYVTNPGFAVNFPDLPLSHGDVIVRSGDNVRHISGVNLFHFMVTPEGNFAIIASRAEEAITSAILNVLSDDVVRVAILTGNGASVSQQLNMLLTDNNYIVETVPLATAVLDDFDIAFLLAPTIDLSENIIRNLEAFLYNNGQFGKTLFYTAGPMQGDMPNLDMFFSEWGVRFGDGAVFETNADRTYQFQPFYPTVLYEDSRAYDLLRDRSMPFLMPLSRPMEILFNFRDGFFVEPILSFSDTTGVRPTDAREDFTAEMATRRGPMPAMAISSFRVSAHDGAQLESNIVFSSSTAIFEPISLQNTSLNNAEFLLNLLGDLAGRDDIISLPPVSLAGRTLGITSSQASNLGVILVGIIPLSILLAGITVWLVRRYR